MSHQHLVIPQKKLRYFSPHSLDLILTCPRKFLYYKTDTPGTFAANRKRDFGSMFHLSIHDYYTKFQNTITKKDNIANKIQERVKKLWNDYDLRSMEPTRDKCIEDFVDFEFKRISNPENRKQPVYTEVDVIVKGDYFERRAIVDMYNNGVAVDWKTGKFEKFDRKMLIQGKYSEIVLEKTDKPVRYMLFVVLGQSRFLPLPFFSIDVLKNYEKQAIEIIKVGEFPKELDKKKNPWCNYCEYNIRCMLSDQDICMFCEDV